MSMSRTAIDALIAEVREELVESRDPSVGELLPELPPAVLAIKTTEAQYVFDSQAIPIRHMDFRILRAALEDTYGLSFDLPSNVTSMAPWIGESASDPDEIGRLLLSQGKSDLLFTDGLLRTRDGKGVTISRVTVNFERINVNIHGTTKAAEHLITELVPLMWACVGVRRSWEELRVMVQVVHYGTATSVDFPDGARGFLSPAFTATLNKWCAAGGLGSKMGDRRAGTNWNVLPGAASSFALDDINLIFERKVNLGFDAEQTRLKIGVTMRSDYGTGRMTVVSELPLPEHLELVEDLITAFTDERSGDS